MDLAPIYRRALALGILCLLGMFALSFAILPLLSQAELLLEELADVRFERARLEALQRRPAPRKGETFPSESFFHAKNGRIATSRLMDRLASLAKANKITISFAGSAEGDQTYLIHVDFTVTGSEKNVVSFIAALEHESPVIRLETWEIQSSNPPDVAFRASAKSVWGRS